ncbi:MAG: hypothetical protein Kow0069_03530 [Promethearchaeota archaeon]
MWFINRPARIVVVRPNLIDALTAGLPPPHAPERTLLASRLSDSAVAFTVVGPAVDSLVDRLLEIRAADQKAVADEAVRAAFSVIFPAELEPLFNLVLHVSEKVDVRRFRELYEQQVPVEDLERMLEAPDEPYVKREIDGALLVVLPLPSGGGRPGYTLVEMKLFTAPPEDPRRVTRRLLRRAVLESYFQVRHAFGLLGFSYLHEEGVEEPAAASDPRLEGVRGVHRWAAHLALCTEGVLDEYPDARARAAALHEAFREHQERLALVAGGVKFILSLTPNLIKVIKLSSVISDLRSQLSRMEEEKRRMEEEKRRMEEEKRRMEEEKRRMEEKLKELRRRAEEEKRRAEEEKRRAEEEKRRAEEEKRRAEEEKRRAEEEKRRAETYRKKLEELGFLDE